MINLYLYHRCFNIFISKTLIIFFISILLGSSSTDAMADCSHEVIPGDCKAGERWDIRTNLCKARIKSTKKSTVNSYKQPTSSSYKSSSTTKSSGRCRYPSDRAKDGSRCGKRSAASRPGGK